MSRLAEEVLLLPVRDGRLVTESRVLQDRDAAAREFRRTGDAAALVRAGLFPRQGAVARELTKAPPGPPPRPGLEWKEETRRWIRPQEEGVQKSEQQSFYCRLSDLWTSEHVSEVIKDLEEGKYIPQRAPSYQDASEHVEIRAYLGLDAYQLNVQLRAGKPLSTEYQNLVNALEKLMHPVQEQVVVYRGMPGRLEVRLGDFETRSVQAGDILSINSFMSTSRNPMTAFEFVGAESETSTFLEIIPMATARAITLANDDTDSYNEDETIFGLIQELVIKEVYENWEVPFGGQFYGSAVVGQYIVATLRPRATGGRRVQKAPPGPPPRPGLEWRERTRRWVCPLEGCEKLHPEDHEGGEVWRPRHQQSLSGSWSSEHVEELHEELRSRRHYDPRQSPSYQNIARHPVLQRYQGSKYQTLNRAMRMGVESPEEQEFAEEITSLMQPLQEELVVYRGVGRVLMDVEPGNVRSVDAFMSTSRHPQTAFGFINSVSEESTYLEIHPSPGVRAITLSNQDSSYAEDETLFDVGQELVVEEVYSNQEVPLVTWEADWKEIKRRQSPVGRYVVATLRLRSEAGQVVSKAPPGLPPRPGLEWRERTHRWVCPAEGCEALHDHGGSQQEKLVDSGKEGRSDVVASRLVHRVMGQSGARADGRFRAGHGGKRGLTPVEARRYWEPAFGGRNPREALVKALSQARVAMAVNSATLSKILKTRQFQAAVQTGKTFSKISALEAV